MSAEQAGSMDGSYGNALVCTKKYFWSNGHRSRSFKSSLPVLSTSFPTSRSWVPSNTGLLTRDFDINDDSTVCSTHTVVSLEMVQIQYIYSTRAGWPRFRGNTSTRVVYFWNYCTPKHHNVFYLSSKLAKIHTYTWKRGSSALQVWTMIYQLKKVPYWSNSIKNIL